MKFYIKPKWFVVLSVLIIGSQLFAAQVIDLSTGKVSGSSPAAQMPINSPDQNYMVRIVDNFDIQNPFVQVKVCSNYLINNPSGTNWIAPQSGVRWISPRVDGSGNPTQSIQNPIYYTTYRKSFYLEQSHCDIESVLLNFNKFAADNIVKIRVNGVDHLHYESTAENNDIVPSEFSPSFIESFQSFYSGSASIDPSLFVAGLNTIDIIVENINTEFSYTGLLIDGDLTINYFHVWAPTIVGSSEFCSNETITLTGSPTTFFSQSYRWWIDECTVSGSIVSGGLSNHDSWTTGTVGNYTIPFNLNCDKYYLVRLYVMNKCGQIKSVSKKIRVLCAPKVNAGPDFSICKDNNAVLNFTSTHWPVTITNNLSTSPNGTFYSSPVYLATPNTITYTISSPAVGACSSTSDQVIVTVQNPNPNFTYSKSTSGGVCHIDASTTIPNLISKWNLYSCDANGGAEVAISPTISGSSASFNPPATYGVYYKITHTAGTKSCLKTKSYFFPAWGLNKSNSVLDMELDTNDESEFIENNEIVDDVNIAPNPSIGVFQIDLSEVKASRICVIDLFGKELYQCENIENDKVEIDLTNFPSNIYIVHIYTDTQHITKRIIKN
jgi:hypothetical protein